MKLIHSLFFLLLLGGAFAAGTPAGTEIKNRAEATYINPDGNVQTVASDEVVTTVLPVYDFVILPNGASPDAPGQTVTAVAGSAAQFFYTVTNQGNITDTITLTLAQAGDDFNLSNVRIYLDEDGNGVLDAGEPLVTEVQLGAGESAQLIVIGTVPEGTVSGATANVNLEGVSVGVPDNTDTDNWARAVLGNDNGGGGNVAGVNIGNSDGDPDTAPNDGGLTESAQPGKAVSFPLELTNTGSAPDTFDLSIVNLPDGWTAALFADADCDGEADNEEPVTTVGPLEPGENICFILTVTPAADAQPGSVPVTATAVSQSDPSKRDSITNLVIIGDNGGGQAGAEIVLEKSVSPAGSVVSGATLTYTVTAISTGDAAATGVSVSDPLPANTAFVSASASTTLDGATLYSADGSSWSTAPPSSLEPGASLYVGVDTNGDATLTDADTFGPNETLTLTLTVQVTGGPEVSNQAEATYGDGSASSETVTTPVDNAAPEPEPARCAVSVTPDGTEEVPGQLVQALPGSTVYLPYTLQNTTPQNIAEPGDADSTFILSADTLTGEVAGLRIIADSNADGVPDEGEEVVSRLDLAEGESAALLLEVTLTPTPGTYLVNLAASCEGADEDAVDSSDTVNVSQIDVPALNLAAPQKTAVPPAGTALYAGAAVSYVVTFTAPELPLENVVVRDVLDPKLALPTTYTTGTVTDPATGLSTEAVATLENRTLRWTFTEVPAGMTVTLAIETQVAADAAVTETVDNTACIAALSLSEVCSAPVTHPLAPVELSLSKTALSPSVTVGDTLTYELVATNLSDVVPVTEGTLTDTLPEGLEYLPDSAVRLDSAGTTEPFEPTQTGLLVWNLPDLAPSTSLTLRFDVRVTAAALGQETLLNRAEFDALGSDGGVVASQEDEAAVAVEAGFFVPGACCSDTFISTRTTAVISTEAISL